MGHRLAVGIGHTWYGQHPVHADLGLRGLYGLQRRADRRQRHPARRAGTDVPQSRRYGIRRPQRFGRLGSDHRRCRRTYRRDQRRRRGGEPDAGSGRHVGHAGKLRFVDRNSGSDGRSVRTYHLDHDGPGVHRRRYHHTGCRYRRQLRCGHRRNRGTDRGHQRCRRRCDGDHRAGAHGRDDRDLDQGHCRRTGPGDVRRGGRSGRTGSPGRQSVDREPEARRRGSPGGGQRRRDQRLRRCRGGRCDLETERPGQGCEQRGVGKLGLPAGQRRHPRPSRVVERGQPDTRRRRGSRRCARPDHGGQRQAGVLAFSPTARRSRP